MALSRFREAEFTRDAGLRHRVVLPSLFVAFVFFASQAAADPRCAPDDAGLRLPKGFCALEVSGSVGPVRNLAVAPNGDVYAAMRSRGQADGGVLALRDVDGDGKADQFRRFGRGDGHGIALDDEYLYYAAADAVVRWRRKAGELVPAGEPEAVVGDFPEQRSHPAKALALGAEGALFVTVGAPSNACQRETRTPRSPGLDPCPQRALHAGVWRYASRATGQRHNAEARVASGMRHTLGLAVDPASGSLWGAVNGRDQLASLWGFASEASAELPAEELARIEPGVDLGWPYCFHDGQAERKVMSPEYGGDGADTGRCADKTAPDLAFPAHWAPMALAFYAGDAFPARYHGGLFVAFRGSWNRAPLPQAGFQVAFVPFVEGRPSGPFETFAVGAENPLGLRMTGVAVGPDGSLFVSADANQQIWRVLPKQ